MKVHNWLFIIASAHARAHVVAQLYYISAVARVVGANVVLCPVSVHIATRKNGYAEVSSGKISDLCDRQAAQYNDSVQASRGRHARVADL